MSPGHNTLSDAGLIARVIAQRDPHAFRQLVLRYQSSVRRWARRFHDGNEAAADDLAQEVFIRVHRALPTYRGEACFSTWLYRITFNIAISQKRLARERWEAVNLEEVESELPHVEHPFGTTEVRHDLETAMATLSEPQQWALRLNLEEGLSHQEVAEVMGIPLGTVKTHLLRGKRALQTRLAHWQEIHP